MWALVTSALGASTSPSQVRLAFGGDAAYTVALPYPNGMTAAWYTTDPTTTSVCHWRISGATAWAANSTDGSATQYLASHGYHHSATMAPLAAATVYEYACGSDASGWSPTFRFTTPSHDVEASFAVSIFGDMGFLGSAERPMIITISGLKKEWSAVPTRKRLEALKNAKEITSIWHLGDIGYLDDSYAHTPVSFSYEKDYNSYMDWLQNLTTTLPYMTTPGNHESECHSPACIVGILGKGEKLKNFTAYNARWKMPSRQSRGVEAMWYSWNQGAIHFVGANSETDWKGAGEETHGDSGILPAGGFAPDGAYLAWLEADLAAARAPGSPTKWIVVGGHRPIGDIATSHGPLFQKYGVELYVAGHTHSYARSAQSVNITLPSAVEMERTATTSRAYSPRFGYGGAEGGGADVVNSSETNGTVYIVVGGAGCDEMDDKPTTTTEGEAGEVGVDAAGASAAARRHRPMTAVAPAGAGPIYATDVLASGVLKVFNSTHLRWQLLRSIDGVILDELWLVK